MYQLNGLVKDMGGWMKMLGIDWKSTDSDARAEALRKSVPVYGTGTESSTGTGEARTALLRQQQLQRDYIDGLIADGVGKQELDAALADMEKMKSAQLAANQWSDGMLTIGNNIDDTFWKMREKSADGDAARASFEESTAMLANSFQSALEVHNQGQLNYIAMLASKSTSLQTALLSAKDMTAEGFEELAKLTETSAKKFSEDARAMSKSMSADKPPPAAVNIGSATFNLFQYFDDDPDCVAIVFHRDVVQAATSRKSAQLR